MRLRRARLLPLLALPVLALPLAVGSEAAPAQATYKTYAVGTNGGEPTLGWDDRAGAVLYQSILTTTRMTWDGAGRMRTKDVSSDYTSVESFDPIVFTDPQTHRTFVSQLYLACSFMAFTDDAGETWTPSEGCGPGAVVDHQTVGGGPYRAESKPLTAGLTGYPNAVYYCAQSGYHGTCSRSDDGGLTFGPGVPAYNTPANLPGDPYGGACSAIHGHVKVAPDGVVYLPNKGCGGTPTAANLTNSEFFGGSPALSVSEDNGLTWTVRKVPGARNQDESDPSVAFDKQSTVFFGWQDGTNPSETVYGRTSAAKIAVSRDHGRTWTKPYDVSSALGIKNVQFPTVVAGDPGRAAIAFLGTKGVGDDQHNGFKGDWHLYVATTTDGGKTWKTVNATPRNVIQRGCISLQGISNKTVLDGDICSQRNLLDFNDIAIDRQGRVLVALADGCTGPCEEDAKAASRGAVDLLVRQTSGPLLRVKGTYRR